MESYGIVSTAQIGKNELRPMVIEKGGHWEADWNYGVLEIGNARIYVDLDKLSNSYSEEELLVLQEILGSEPVSSVGVAYSSNDESERMAKQFCEELIERFGGYFEDNFTDLVPDPPETEDEVES
jgi:hypothetical protein